MKQYQSLIQDVLRDGERRQTRSGPVLSIFGPQARYDLREGFPLVTTKKTLYRSVVQELLWFLRGETNINTLGNGIWNEWADERGDLGPVYGRQWRSWGREYDQILDLLTGLATDPASRRHIVSAWNVKDLSEMALPPCHTMFQCHVQGHYLDMKLYQRSGDLMLGVPFNIASYATLMHILAQQVDLTPRFFYHTFGDLHIYENHKDAAYDVLRRKPFPLPHLTIAPKPLPYPGCPRDGSVLEVDDFHLEGYQHHPFIKLPVAI